jgi:hypothetical protein
VRRNADAAGQGRDKAAFVDRVLAWNNVNLPGAQGQENRVRHFDVRDASVNDGPRTMFSSEGSVCLRVCLIRASIIDTRFSCYLDCCSNFFLFKIANLPLQPITLSSFIGSHAQLSGRFAEALRTRWR